MAEELRGMKIAFMVANEGVERVELVQPWEAVRAAGGEPVLVAPQKGKVQSFDHLDKSEVFQAGMSTSELAGEEIGGVVLPGGVANPDQLRQDRPAIAFLRSHMEAGRPLAAICHGPWCLVEADQVRDRTLTSWPSLQTDIRNAGGHWVDQETCIDGRLLTSRGPQDLEAFDSELVRLFSTVMVS